MIFICYESRRSSDYSFKSNLVNIMYILFFLNISYFTLLFKCSLLEWGRKGRQTENTYFMKIGGEMKRVLFWF